jgi:hypothetical protein
VPDRLLRVCVRDAVAAHTSSQRKTRTQQEKKKDASWASTAIAWLVRVILIALQHQAFNTPASTGQRMHYILIYWLGRCYHHYPTAATMHPVPKTANTRQKPS